MFDSDDFDPSVCRNTKVLNGFNLKELLETGSTNFETESEKVNRDFKDKMRLDDEVATVETLEDPFVQVYSSIKFRGVDEHGESLTDFDGTFEELEKIMETIEPDGGLKKLIMKPGMMGDPIQVGQVVYVNYFICLEGMDAPVDNSRTHLVRGRKDQPFRFKVGEGTVLRVLDKGVVTMQLQEVAKFLATPENAYGKLGCPPRIPPNTRAMVTIEVLGIDEGSMKTNLVDMDKTERMALPFDELYKGVLALKNYGTDAFKYEEFSKASKHYKEALKILHDIVTPREAENKLKMKMLYTLNINIAQCAIMRSNFKSGKEYCEIAIGLPLPKVKKVKAYYRLAKCLEELGDVGLAKKNIDITKALDPANVDVVALFNKINCRILKNEQDEKEYAKNMFDK